MTIDFTKAMQANSDQLNAVDLIVPRTIKIRDIKQVGVKGKNGIETRIHIFFDGDEGKPWVTSKTALRLLVPCWGLEEEKWIGLHCTIYNDESVKWGGEAVGGIRPSHVEGIIKPRKISVLITRGVRKVVEMLPLKIKAETTPDTWKARLFTVIENPDLTVEAAWKKTPKDIQEVLGGQKFYEQLIEMEKATQEHSEPDEGVVDELNNLIAAE